MLDLDRAEKHVIIFLTAALLVGLGFAAYQKSRSPAIRIERFSANRPKAGFAPHADARGAININTASAEELMMLKGVGKVLADRIVEYRNTSGYFISAGDIMKVRGVGQALYAKIKDRISVQ